MIFQNKKIKKLEDEINSLRERIEKLELEIRPIFVYPEFQNHRVPWWNDLPRVSLHKAVTSILDHLKLEFRMEAATKERFDLVEKK